MRLTLLVSGNLGLNTLKQLYAVECQIAFVFTDRRSKQIIEYCADRKIEVFIGNPRRGRARGVLARASCEVLLSVNYLYIIEKDIISLASRYAVNVHGSLLPKYRGRTPHVWAIINGEKEVGITAHLISERMDAGPIVAQRRIPVMPGATGADVLDLYGREYPKLVDTVLSQIAAKKVTLVAQDEALATYFPKRSPEDGRINWQWSRLRAMNWIRAQAPPYPGAFCYLNGEQMIVHRAEYSDLGFHHEVVNGTILSEGGSTIVVKLADGALKLCLDQNALDKEGIVPGAVLQ